MKSPNTHVIENNSIFICIGVVTIAILSIPFAAMQLSLQVDWSILDFVIIGALIFGMGSIFVFIARHVHKVSSRIIVGIACLAILLWIWAELAVGIFTSWGS